MVVWVQEGDPCGIRRMDICGSEIRRVLLPPGGVLRHYRRSRIWKRLQGLRAILAIPRELEGEAGRYGLRGASAAPLRQALLPQLYEKCAVVVSDTAALRAPDTSPEVYRAAAFLAEKVRYLVPELGCGGERLQNWLRRQYGISTGSAGEWACGGVTFCGPPRCAEVCLGEDCRRYQEVTYEVRGWEIPEELLCGLWQAGVIRGSEIRVISVHTALDTTGESRYNTMI